MQKQNQLKKAIKLLVPLLILLGLYFFLRPINTPPRGDTVAEIHHSAFLIGNALLHYQEDHNGLMPTRLSALVPEYISSSNIALFFWPPTGEFAINSSLSERVSHKIDNEGAFIYLGVHGYQENLILYERPNLWPKDLETTSVTTLTTNNFAAKLRSVTDVQNRISRLTTIVP